MKSTLPKTLCLSIILLYGGLLSGQYLLEPELLVAPVALTGFEAPQEVLQFSLDHKVTEGHQEEAMVLTLPIGEFLQVFELHRRELRSAHFKRSFASGTIDREHRLSGQFLGQVQASPGSIAYFTFDQHFLMGHWEVNGIRWVLEPLWFTDDTAARDIYLLFREDNLAETDQQCNVSGSDDIPGSGRSSGWIGAREIELAVAVDSLMYRQFPDAGSVENFVLGLLNLVQGDYDRGFQNNLCFQLVDLYLSDAPEREVWNTTLFSETLIDDFQVWGNFNEWANEYDMATLWTGRNLRSVSSGANNIGYAYIESMCGFFRYHIVENWTQNTAALRAIWSHEIGHNLGARHVDGTTLIMNPTLGPGNTRWSNTARQAINNSLPRFGCLELSPWLAFTASGVGQTSELAWSYTWREANEGFFVERSTIRNTGFQTLNWVPGNENIGDRFYDYLDEGLTPGSIYYYRLRQIDDNGTEFISPVRRVVVAYPEGVRISPNPATDVVLIVSDNDAVKEYRITDITGRVVRSGRVFLGGNEVNLNGLDAGVYLYYEVNEKEISFATKLVKR